MTPTVLPPRLDRSTALAGFEATRRWLNARGLNWLAHSIAVFIDTSENIVFEHRGTKASDRIDDVRTDAQLVLANRAMNVPIVRPVTDLNGRFIGMVACSLASNNQTQPLASLLAEFTRDPNENSPFMDLLIEEVFLENDWDLPSDWPHRPLPATDTASSQAGLQALITGAAQAGLLHSQSYGVPPLETAPATPGQAGLPSEIVDIPGFGGGILS